jgi:uncharacterized membrane protein
MQTLERFQNIRKTERWLSAAAGGTLLGWGMRQRPSKKSNLMKIGGAILLARGISGFSPFMKLLGIQHGKNYPPAAVVGHQEGRKIEKSLIIHAPADQLFGFWRNFENLPKFMNHLESVEILSDRISRWTAKAPAGSQVVWEAEVYNEIPFELIAWRSLPGSQINHAGSVHFREIPGTGTEVRVALNYEPPAGPLGALIAKMFGEEPEQQIQEDLQSFKEFMEAGPITDTIGKSSSEQVSR